MMKLNLLVAVSQLNSLPGKSLGTGTMDALRHLAELMVECGIHGHIYDLPNGSRNPDTASPFSLNNGFALNTDELNVDNIPELHDNPELSGHIGQISSTHDRFFENKRTVSYALKRTLMPWILGECYQVFLNRDYYHRRQQFDAFLEKSAYWIEDYALYEVFKERDIDLSGHEYRRHTNPEVLEFKEKHRRRMEYFKYIQFLCFEQRQQIRTDLRKLNTGLIVNLPFGVETHSADVFFHPEVFDFELQVGCSPEPEHGYPEQAWGIAAYREKTPGLRNYLEEKMRWISGLGDGVFLDHLVGWCGQYVLPMVIPSDSVYPHGSFLTEDPTGRKENIRWFLDIVVGSGLQIRGEIAGDHKRVEATNAVLEEMIRQGADIGAMAIPRWENEKGRLKPLRRYEASTLTMVETHDTSTLLQYLINRKGYDEDFEKPERILEFCNRVVGLPFHVCDVPLTIEECTREFWFEVCRRFSEGTPSKELVFTLPGLISILSNAYRSASIENNINVKPGTSGAVGNGWGNWSYFSAPVETMKNDRFLNDALKRLGNRKYRPFDYFHDLKLPEDTAEGLKVVYSKVDDGRQIVYRNASSQWDILNLPVEFGDIDIDLELVIYNSSQEEIWERIDLDEILDLKRDVSYSFQDLNGDRSRYAYSVEELRTESLFVRLRSKQIHHFLVFENR
ncbi:MAG: 4-alpha-glucanotransferase [Proteobacteria bacterium]|nr:4-alpha-glucanotransferase [Pseudomonadota bacterium]